MAEIIESKIKRLTSLGKRKQATLRKVESVFTEINKNNILGVYYTNDYLDETYLARRDILVDSIIPSKTNDSLNVMISSRVENSDKAVLQMTNTHEALIDLGLGSVKGLIPENIYDEELSDGVPFIVEPISSTTDLISFDVDTTLTNNDVEYQEFTIGGCNFTLLSITSREGGFYQRLKVLYYNDSDVEENNNNNLTLGIFSLLYDREDLTSLDGEKIMRLIADENMLGKAITSVRYNDTLTGVVSTMYPMDGLLGISTNTEGAILITAPTGALIVPVNALKHSTFSCTFTNLGGVILEWNPKSNSKQGIYFKLTTE